MESWAGYNYYTTDPDKWVNLINLSTVEWGVAPLPPNVFAIPGSLNASYAPGDFPNNSIIIENAAKTQFGSRDIEKIVFGITSGLAIAWGLGWLWWTWRKGDLFKPRNHNRQDGDPAALHHLLLSEENSDFVSAAKLRDELYNSYYEPGHKGPEMEDTSMAVAEGTEVKSEDVEALIALVQKMYAFDLKLWAHQSDESMTASERDSLRRKSDAILADVRRVIISWNDQIRNNPGAGSPWSQVEVEMLRLLEEILTVNLPTKRYHTER
ncbi:hypothetical protein QBC46DRAFT_39759 [Diplogelasinospora grovesii]|uniref:Uncharacterized protein n=1 Tax=Diplogelasinospora grovesii TaxID=303347 RepID=A0AAN6S864_9PEZI|nr:hypothetical protein QBC46DRAFT_39759 [Diplogelasinospora grovesii]